MDRIVQALNGTRTFIGLVLLVVSGAIYVYSLESEIARIDRYGTQAGEVRGHRIDALEESVLRVEWNIYLLGRERGIQGLVTPPEGRPTDRRGDD